MTVGVCFICARPSVLPDHKVCALCHVEETCATCRGLGYVFPDTAFPLRSRSGHRRRGNYVGADA